MEGRREDSRRERGARWANNEGVNLSKSKMRERALDRDCVTLIVWGAAENNFTPLEHGSRSTDHGAPKVVFAVQEQLVAGAGAGGLADCAAERLCVHVRRRMHFCTADWRPAELDTIRSRQH